MLCISIIINLIFAIARNMLGGGFIQVIEDSTMDPAEGINYFIDKSPFIHELITDHTKNLLIVRPRKLCKTVNLEMAKEFLSPECLAVEMSIKPKFGDTSSAIYFKGGEYDDMKFDRLKIAENEEFFKKHQGQHPVVFLSMGLLKIGSYTTFKESFAQAIAATYGNHLPIAISLLCSELGESLVEATLESTKLNFDDPGYHMKIYKQLVKAANSNEVTKMGKSSILYCKAINKELADEQLERSLLLLVEMVKQFYDNRKVYVFVDDHDAAIFKMIKEFILIHPDERKQIMQDITHASNLITSMLGLVSQDKNTVEKMVLTGSTALLNNHGNLKGIKVYTMASEPYKEFFCFTQAQVNQLVKRMNQFRLKSFEDEENSKNGLFNLQSYYIWDHENYRFYDPWSVISYLEQCKEKSNGIAENRDYWNDTGNCCILDNVDSVDDEAYSKLGSIITGSTEINGKVELSRVTLDSLLKMLTYERTIKDMVAYFVLEADGYIVTAETKEEIKGYRMSNKIVGERYKKSLLDNWLTLVLGGPRPHPSEAYAVRTKDIQRKKESTSSMPSHRRKKTSKSNLTNDERNGMFRGMIRGKQLDTMFEGIRSEMQMGAGLNENDSENEENGEKRKQVNVNENEKEKQEGEVRDSEVNDE